MGATTGMLGHSATVTVEGAAIAESTDFSLTLGQEVVDMSNRDGSHWRQLISSMRSWSISGTGNYFVANIGKRVLVEHWENRDTNLGVLTLTVIFTFADGAVTAQGEAILTSLDFPSPHAGAAVFSFTLEGTDALAISAS